MTISCAVTDGTHIVMGGDSALSTDGGDQTIGQPKVFELGDLLIGCSGELRVAQLLKHVFEVPLCNVDQDPEEYVIKDFARQFHLFLSEEAPYLIPGIENEDELWNLLIGVRGRIFRVCSHFSVRESSTGYDAIGSGTPLALGSLASTERLPALERVKLALAAAERHVTSVSQPFRIIER